jgi:outer membrane lipoprotein-sorting protein
MRRPCVLPAVLLLTSLLPAQDDLESIFARMQDRQKGIQTLEVRFVQEKTSSLLVKPVVSQGTMSYARPDRIRWEYLAPDPYTILILGDTFQAYYPTLKKLKTARITRMRHRIFNFLLATEPLDKLKNHFQVELRYAEKKPSFTLVLTPLTPRLAKYIHSVTLVVDKKILLPMEILILEKDKDSSRLVFSNPKINSILPEGTFRLDIPPGTVTEDYQAAR